MILIAGDVHGKIISFLKLIKKAERRLGKRATAVLQVGDLGIWSKEENMDRASRYHAKKDPEELQWKQLVNPSPEILSWIKRSWIPEIYFIRGNHEDFSLIEQRGEESLCGLGIFFHLPAGKVLDIDGHRVAGLGGIYYRGSNSQKAALPKYTKPWEVETLLKLDFELLISHDCPENIPEEGKGSPLVSQVLEIKRPKYLFCGHYHCSKTFDLPWGGKLVVLNQLGDESTKGFMAALEGNNLILL